MSLRPATRAAVALFMTLSCLPGRAQEPDASVTLSKTERPPRIALVLSGGGARGIAHVGILKVLKEARVPVDMVIGTSMGAIVGGLYASGMSPEELEKEFLAIDWEQIFAAQVARQDRPQRRRDDDADLSGVVELGLRDGEIRAPLAAVSGRGLERLLRQHTLRVRSAPRFDELPIPFRAVATNMETGTLRVLDHGDLARALRASMSVPGIFAPTDWHGEILGDGGLVANLPVEVAQEMGADIILAINIGTPLAPRSSLQSALGLTQQSINILTEQNVVRSIRRLRDGVDLLVSPNLDGMTSTEFERAREFIARGETEARRLMPLFQRLSVSQEAYARWDAQRLRKDPPPTQLAFVRTEGHELSRPDSQLPQFASQPGQAFSTQKAELDLRHLTATGDYARVDYRLERTNQGEGLVFETQDKPWGPNYFRFGLGLETDFAGEGGFNVRMGHVRRWLTDRGAEWRNHVQLGNNPKLNSEVYSPLGWKTDTRNDWFASTWVDMERRSLYSPIGERLPRLRSSTDIGLDLGQPLKTLGEFRMGVHALFQGAGDVMLPDGTLDPAYRDRIHEGGFQARLVFDQLDDPWLPRKGWRVKALWERGMRGLNQHSWTPTLSEGERQYRRTELQGETAWTVKQQTVSLKGLYRRSDTPPVYELQRYAMGGLFNMSGFSQGEIQARTLTFGRVMTYRPLKAPGGVSGSMIWGASWEWVQLGQPAPWSPAGHRYGASLFVGSRTSLGPVRLAWVYGQGVGSGLVFSLGQND